MSNEHSILKLLQLYNPTHKSWSATSNTVPIGGRSKTGAVRIAPDCFVSAWVIKGAPFKARQSNSIRNDWRIDDKHGNLMGLGMNEVEAIELAERYNTLAVTALMMLK